MEVSLTKTPLQTETGADASGLPLATGDGAIFDALMAASLVQTGVSADGSQVNTPTLPMPQALPALPEADAAPAGDEATQSLAQDLENMVQALAITAEVVVKGMSERAPVREIILKVESPQIDPIQSADLPDLTVLPPQMDEALKLKISTLDATKLPVDAVMAQALAPQADEQRVVAQDEATALTNMEGPSAEPNDELMQRNPEREEMQGPFRSEMHGPFISAEKALISAPLYIVSVDEPVFVETKAMPLVTMHALPEVIEEAHLFPETPGKIDPMPDQNVSVDATPHDIPVLIVKVPVRVEKLVTAEHDTDDTSWVGPQMMSAEAPSHHVVLADPVLEDQKSIHVTGQPDVIAQVPVTLMAQTMPMVQPQFSRAEIIEKSDDLMDAPRAKWQQEDLIGPKIPADVRARQTWVVASAPNGATAAQPSTKPFVSTIDAQGEGEGEPRLDVVVKGDPTALPRVVASNAIKTALETNVSAPVANNSSRSNANIRDLVKLGVRDIEIIQTSSTLSTGIVSQPMQILTQDLNASAPRSAVSETAVNSARDHQSNAERRAEAHDMRMRAIERQVIAAVRDGSETIRMQLYPPGLGQVMIRLTMEGARLKLSTRASSSEAVESLRGIENDLRDALSTSGLELAGFDVSEENEQRQGRQERPEQNQTVTRGVKSEDFALDMNA